MDSLAQSEFLLRQNNAGHQARMASIKATGKALIENGRRYSAMADSRHKSWRRNQAISDAGHTKTIDGIWERKNMTDQSGNTFKIDGYDTHVWKNGNDEYFGTDDGNYDPNIHNNENWEQLQKTND